MQSRTKGFTLIEMAIVILAIKFGQFGWIHF